MIVVHGNHSILAVPIDGLSKHVLQEAARNLMWPSKVLTFIGGVQNPTQSTDNSRYVKAPVLVIRSKQQHAIRNFQATASASDDRDLIVDLHTSECPIDVTAHNASVSLADAGLADCATDGILTILTVQRCTSAKSELIQCKAGTFQKSAA